MSKPNRKAGPIFLNLLQIRQPVTAVVSILHRLAGVLMVLAVPAMVYLFGLSLSNPAGYRQVARLLGNPVFEVVAAVLVWSLVHHLLAGIRYFLIDVDIGVQRAGARASAWVVIAGSLAVLALFLGMIA